MAKILLVNFDEERGGRLAVFLRMKQHTVVDSCGYQPVSQLLERSAVDLVILDVSHPGNDVRSFLVQIFSYRTHHGPRPGVLCISRVYRGPRFALDLERKGARVVYV